MLKCNTKVRDYDKSLKVDLKNESIFDKELSEATIISVHTCTPAKLDEDGDVRNNLHNILQISRADLLIVFSNCSLRET